MHVLGGTNQKFDEYQTWYELNFASAVAGGVAGTWKRNLGVDTNVGNGQGLTLVHFSAQLEPCLTQ
jgi:hypothetical protein